MVRLALAGENACPSFQACEALARASFPRLSDWREAGALLRVEISTLNSRSLAQSPHPGSLRSPILPLQGRVTEQVACQELLTAPPDIAHSEIHLQAVQAADVAVDGVDDLALVDEYVVEL